VQWLLIDSQLFLEIFFWKVKVKNGVFSQPEVLALGEEADFEALNCLPAQNLIPCPTAPFRPGSSKLHLTTEPPIFCRCCYAFALFIMLSLQCSSSPMLEIARHNFLTIKKR